MTSETAAKKDVQKLQRAIVDGLEDVKAQDIQVFNTEHLSALFERVVIATGTSNRQTKALAASVRDSVRDAGFGKPRIEGEENGEWIIVDCGAAVAHIMQPAIRQYYHLEEIWGEKPIRMRHGAPKPLPKASEEPEPAKPAKAGKAGKAGVKPAAKPAAKSARKTGAQDGASARTVAKDGSAGAAGRTAAKTGAKAAPKNPAKSAARSPARSKASPASGPSAPARTAPRKAPARRSPPAKG